MIADIAPDHSRVIELDIPNDVRFIERVVELVQRECRDLHFAQRQVMLNVPVALTEALSNAILRGNSDDPPAYSRQYRLKKDVTCSGSWGRRRLRGWSRRCSATDP